MKEYEELLKYLKANKIPGATALRVIKQAVSSNSTNKRTMWKMTRFQMYLWERLKEFEENEPRRKILTITDLVKSTKYKKAWKLFNTGKMDEFLELKRLNQLIAEPRQELSWNSKNFFYEGQPTKKIPQDIIDKIR